MAARRHPRLVEDAFAKAIVDAARCRGTRAHRMDPIPSPQGAPRPLYGSLITFRCELCGTLRFDVVQRNNGRLMSRSYDYPDWYEQANDDRQDPAWWRTRYWDTLGDEYFLEAEPVTQIATKRAARKRASS